MCPVFKNESDNIYGGITRAQSSQQLHYNDNYKKKGYYKINKVKLQIQMLYNNNIKHSILYIYSTQSLIVLITNGQ